MNAILDAWNRSERTAAVSALLSCCAAQRWTEGVTAMRPFMKEEDLFAAADHVWAEMQEADWMQAFRAHPRIGDRKPVHASAQSSAWSRQEQASADTAQAEVLAQLARGNERYEELFGFTYIVCATGKSAEEMLGILQRRLASDRQTELREAAEQQRQITQIRLRKWLQV
jgi:2-oxo-4-hydroxy-4-carboxy-5-ureidoimidazoline decarboxylase